MYNFEGMNKFIVQQQKEWGEILTGFEVKNKYKVFDVNGKELFFAFEEKSNWFVRQFLQGYRPFTFLITDLDKKIAFRVVRPFRWIYQEATIYDSNNAPLGTIRMEFSFFQRRYNIFAPDNSLLFRLFGPFFKPWTLKIMENEQEVGIITKKWSGALKEIFTKADNFGAEFPVSWSNEKKGIVLGAIFLIDFIQFERKG